MTNGYAVYVGDVALDEYYRADSWPTVKDKALVQPLPAMPGGMIANAACVAAGLGMQVKFLAALNRGAITQFLLADLEKIGVDTSLVVFDDSLPDAKCMIFLVGDEHTVLIPTMGITAIEITTDQLDVLAQARYIYSTPIEFELLRCGTMNSDDIIDYCRRHGAQLVYDLDVDYINDGDEARYRRLDVAFFNEVGYDRYRGALDARAAADRLLSYGIQVVVVTLAERGCVVYERTQTIAVPGVAVTVVDVTGAGDLFASGFLLAYARGRDYRTALQAGCLAASEVISHIGARPVADLRALAAEKGVGV